MNLQDKIILSNVPFLANQEQHKSSFIEKLRKLLYEDNRAILLGILSEEDANNISKELIREIPLHLDNMANNAEIIGLCDKGHCYQLAIAEIVNGIFDDVISFRTLDHRDMESVSDNFKQMCEGLKEKIVEDILLL